MLNLVKLLLYMLASRVYGLWDPLGPGLPSAWRIGLVVRLGRLGLCHR